MFDIWTPTKETAARLVRPLFFLTALLTTATGLGLSASLHFPEVLLDNRSFADSLVDAHPVAVVVSMLGMLTNGAALLFLSRVLAELSPEDGRLPALVLGQAAALCWGVSGLLGLVLVPLWSGNSGGVGFLAGAVFVGVALLGPLLVAAWTVVLVRQFRTARVIGVLGIAGLVLTVLRSLLWWVDTLQPAEGGYYATASILTVLTLLVYPLWIWWLVRMGFQMNKSATETSRPVALVVARGLGVGLLGTVFVAVHAIAMILSTPTPRTDDVPAVPSAAGATRYLVGWALRDQFALPGDYRQLLAERQRDTNTHHPVVPSFATLRNVDADGVPAEQICAGGAATDRALLYLPGGGFILPPSNNVRTFAANISRETGICVFLLHYRLAPENAFPAPVEDAVKAYRWIRRQGIPAARTAIFGDSAGGNLTLTTALSLRDSGDELPAALVSISPCTDFTFSGTTFRTKSDVETLIFGDTVDFTYRSYARSGAGNLRDPLLSPLYSDPKGLPPTLLMAGSQETLLSDSIRMADRMRTAGVTVKLETWPGMPHSWINARKPTMETRLGQQHISAFISEHIS